MLLKMNFNNECCDALKWYVIPKTLISYWKQIECLRLEHISSIRAGNQTFQSGQTCTDSRHNSHEIIGDRCIVKYQPTLSEIAISRFICVQDWPKCSSLHLNSSPPEDL